MSYRCSVCRAKVPPKRPLLRHVLYRPNREIERELPVCANCKADLDAGAPLLEFVEHHAPPMPRPNPTPKVAQRVVFGRKQ